jgi:hypothetical protein
LISAVSFTDLSKSNKTIIVVYITCLIGASLTHLYDIVSQETLMPYHILLNAPPLSNVFWSSLIYFDLAVAASLAWKPKLGAILTLALILMDVTHNTIACYTFLKSNIWEFPGLQMQIAFMGFVLLSIRSIFRNRHHHTSEVT